VRSVLVSGRRLAGRRGSDEWNMEGVWCIKGAGVELTPWHIRE
jgi:hypothetical protein